jgi:hypothetical protein
VDFDDILQLASHLPRASRDKLRRLMDERSRAAAAVRDCWERVQDERQELQRAKIIAQNQENASIGRPAGFNLNYAEFALREPPPVEQSPSRHLLTDEERDRLNDHVSAAQERLDRAQEALEAAQATFEKFAFVTPCVDWLKAYTGHGGRLGHQKLPSVKLTRGESFREGVERIRAQIAACDDQWAEIEAAPLPLDEIKVEIVRQVDRLAAAGQPKIIGRDAFDGPTDLPAVLRLKSAGGLMMSDVASPFLCWLHHDQIVARLHAIADAQDYAGAMTDDQRDRAFSALLDQKLALNFAEVAAVVAAAADGTVVIRRPDADPRAILQVAEIFADEFSKDGEVGGSNRPARGSAPVLSEGADQ